jgi:hypothetical protein
MIDRLFGPVVENVEVFLFKIEHELAVPIASRHGRCYFCDADSYWLLLRLSRLRRRTFRQIRWRFLRSRIRRRMDWSGRFLRTR